MKPFNARISALSAVVTLLVTSVGAQSPDNFNPSPDNSVSSLLLQPDAKILAGGNFRILAGTSRRGFGRLNPDGTIDQAFAPAMEAVALGMQPDGMLLVGGYTYSPIGYGGGSVFARLSEDGTQVGSAPLLGGCDTLCLQQDGKILVTGSFLRSDWSFTPLVRLNADLSLDESFDPNPAIDLDYAAVKVVVEQPDRKILVTGNFFYLAGQPQTNFGRLYPDGTLDASFNPLQLGSIEAVVLQPDGKIIIGGYFSPPGTQDLQGLFRLNPDGSLDSTFNPGVMGWVDAIALQADGRLLVGGQFNSIGGQSRTNLARLNTDGTLDNSFEPQMGPYSDVRAILLQTDGEVLIAGDFERLDGQSRQFMGRLINTETATQSLSLNNSTLTWSRGGASPEVSRTSFDWSHNDGDAWHHLGEGVRIAGGWELRDFHVPKNATVRARGFTGNSFVETIVGPPVLLESPQSHTNLATTTIELNVYAGGTGLEYQWLKNGTNLIDGGNISGVSTHALVLTDLLGADAGTYAVQITSGLGSVISPAAALTVIDPIIQAQPLSLVRYAGQTATFTAEPVGTAPFTYQWRKEGLAIPAATDASLTLSNLVNSDAAAYDVVIANAWGSCTSSPALLTINQVVADSFAPLAGDRWATVSALALQPDRKILVAGYFSSLGQSRTNLARLNEDGSVDASFNPPLFTNVYYGPSFKTLAVQPDGKILVGGTFSSVAGQSHTNLARLNPDGTVDPTFTCRLMEPEQFLYNQGEVSALLLQPDDKILVGGLFEAGGNTNLVRLNSDGSLDNSFAPGHYDAVPYCWPDALDNPVLTIALQSDGKVVIGGFATVPWASSRDAQIDVPYLVRLEPDGAPDTNFNATVNLNYGGSGVGGYLYSVIVQPDGKLIVGGAFSWLSGDFRSSLARLNPDGTLDRSFDPEVHWDVTSLALQADGKLLVAGWFTGIDGASRTNIARLNPDGSLDPTFAPGTDASFAGLALEADGNILVAGDMTQLAGQPQTGLGRLLNLGEATENLSYDRHSIVWTRGGTSPQFWSAVFEYSTDGSRWISLGRAAATDTGWQLNHVSLPENAIIRGRGFVTGGTYNGSSWFFESTSSPVLAITDFKRLAGGRVQLTGLGPHGQDAVLEVSTDLKTWVPLSTNTLANGSFTFSDPQRGGSSQRFYRLRHRVTTTLTQE